MEIRALLEWEDFQNSPTSTESFACLQELMDSDSDRDPAMDRIETSPVNDRTGLCGKTVDLISARLENISLEDSANVASTTQYRATIRSTLQSVAATPRISSTTTYSTPRFKAAMRTLQSETTTPQYKSKATTRSTAQIKATTWSTAQSKATTRSSPQSKAMTRSSPQYKATTQSTPQSKAMTRSSQQSKATTPSTPQPKPMTRSSPQPKAMTRSSPRSKATTRSSPRSKATTRSSPQSKATARSSPQSKATTQPSPRSKAMAPSTPQSKATTPSSSLSKATTPSTRRSQATTRSTPQSNASTPQSKGMTRPTLQSKATTRLSPQSNGTSRSFFVAVAFDSCSLEMLAIENPTAILEKLQNSSEEFVKLLTCTKLDSRMTIIVAKILAKICSQENYVALLRRVLTKTKLFTEHIPHYLTANPLKHDILWQWHLSNTLKNVATIFKSLATSLTTTELKSIRNLMLTCRNAIEKLDLTCSDRNTIAAEFEKLRCEQEERLEGVREEEEEAEEMLTTVHCVVSEEVIAPFRHIPVYPTKIDMMTKPTLTPNVISGPYGSVSHYLAVHFMLMREDFIGELRDVIDSLTENKQPSRRNAHVCKDVTVGRPKVTNEGMTFVLQCRSQKFPGAGCDGNKTLLGGSLLCISTNNFKSFNVAVVKNNSLLELQSGMIRVEFMDPQFFVRNFNPQRRHVVIAAPSYYEAYRHVLVGLQTLNEETLPFKRYIADVDTDVGRPKYLRLKTCYSLPFSSGGYVQVLERTSWPSAEQLGLDEAQLSAFQFALTHELTLIQGPPGTGKTFLGLKIVETLLDNEHTWNAGSVGNAEKSPILVVCYTNDALDQFLEGVLTFCPTRLIRVGGRSKNEFVNEHNLRNERQGPTFAIGHLYDSRTEARLHIEKNESILKKSMDCIMLKTALRQYMLSKHYGQFATYGDRHNYFDQYPFLEIWLEVVDDLKRYAWNTGWKMAATCKCYSLRTSSILQELRSEDVMRHDETVCIDDIWTLSIGDRWRLYRYWISLLRRDCLERAKSLERQHRKVSDRLSDVHRQMDMSILKAARVVGMTTTGAAKNMKLIKEVGPKIVVMEEAATVLESHVLVSLSESCQHFIMIGDHQQLRPSISVCELAKDYHLDVSMFERLITNGLPFRTLSLQHRMRPEISSLLVPHIYKELRNHSSVEMYDDIRGVCSNMFFVDHEQAESRSKHSTSRSNEHEAAFISSLCRYIVNQGYEQKQITVLTTYLGQLSTIKDAIRMKGLLGVHCASVDSYQGEENDIVLLSLVRSNEHAQVGFMDSTNRVCVALSRAKMGFYCIGNFGLLVSGSEIWKTIVEVLKQNASIGSSLKLRCSNHPDTTTEVTTAGDFDKVSEGGCSRNCNRALPCGHKCQLQCHGYDKEHESIRCGLACESFCEKNLHKCSKLCSDECGNCMTEVLKFYPSCGHQNMVYCYQYGTDVPCKTQCSQLLSCGHLCSNSCGERCSTADSCCYSCLKTLDCGHPCQSSCGDPCSTEPCTFPSVKLLSCGHDIKGLCGLQYGVWDCKEEVTVSAACGHNVVVSCSMASSTKHVLDSCSVVCMEELSCGHLCSGTCGKCVQGRAHVQCVVKCDVTLVCGHRHSGDCERDIEICNRKCQIGCSHGQCPYPCSWPCKPCHRDCEWSCPHYKCRRKCSEVCDRPPCDEPCPKLLRCGHACIGVCGEKCPSLCRICNRSEVEEIFFGSEEDVDARFVVLVDCDHVFEVSALDRWMGLRDNTTAAVHTGSSISPYKKCPKCDAAIMRTARYNDVIKKLIQGFVFVKCHILKRVDLFSELFNAVCIEWKKLSKTAVLPPLMPAESDHQHHYHLVEEKQQRLNEWTRAGQSTPRECVQFYREFLRVWYFVMLKKRFRYVRDPCGAQHYYDKIWKHLTATYQFTVFVEEEVKELLRTLATYNEMAVKIENKLDMCCFFTLRPNWVTCQCEAPVYRTQLETVDLTEGCEICN